MYAQRGDSDTSTSVNLQEQAWRKPITYTPQDLILRFGHISSPGDVPAATADTPSPWRARFVTSYLPPQGWLYFRQFGNPESPVSSADAPFIQSFKGQQLQSSQYFSARLQRFLQGTDAGAGNAGTEGSIAQPYVPRVLPTQYRPQFRYLLDQGAAQDPPPAAGTETPPSWSPPIRYQPIPLTLRFDSGRGYPDVPAAPTPTDTPTPTWFPRPLQQAYRSFPQRYALWASAQDNFGDPPAQLTVFWNYQTNYERVVRQWLTLLQTTPPSGVSIAEGSTFPGFTPNKVQQTTVPTISRFLYRGQPPQDLNTTAEVSAFPGFTNHQTTPGSHRLYPGLRFQQFSDSETIQQFETPPHVVQRYTPAKHTIQRGLFQYTERVATNAPADAPGTWDYRITTPTVRYRPTVHTLVRGINYGLADTSINSFPNAFILDVSTLSGLNLNYIDTPLQERGTSIQMEWSQSGNDRDMQLLGYAVRGVPAESMRQESSNTEGGEFILDSSRLEVPTHYSLHTALDERGRSIQVEWIQSANEQDMQILGYAVHGVPTEGMSQEQS